MAPPLAPQPFVVGDRHVSRAVVPTAALVALVLTSVVLSPTAAAGRPEQSAVTPPAGGPGVVSKEAAPGAGVTGR